MTLYLQCVTFVQNYPGGYYQKNWVVMCGPLPKTLTLFMTKICNFPYPIYDLTTIFLCISLYSSDYLLAASVYSVV